MLPSSAQMSVTGFGRSALHEPWSSIPLLGGPFRARHTDIAACSCGRSSGWRSLSLWSRLGTGDCIGDIALVRVRQAARLLRVSGERRCACGARRRWCERGELGRHRPSRCSVWPTCGEVPNRSIVHRVVTSPPLHWAETGRNRRVPIVSRPPRGRDRTQRGPGLAALFRSGANRDRTGDLLLAKQALSQLSYGPAAIECSRGVARRDDPQPQRTQAPIVESDQCPPPPVLGSA